MLNAALPGQLRSILISRRQFSLGIKNYPYHERNYRLKYTAKDLYYYNVKVKESDLAIGVDIMSYSDSLVSLCEKKLRQVRQIIEDYIAQHPDFKTSLVPIKLQPGAPEIIRYMSDAALMADVGPMAAVAGVVAQEIGIELMNYTQEVLVENGGDIYINTKLERNIAVFAGESPFSHKIGIKVYPEEGPLGICTSSGTVGPSLSFGQADAVVVKAQSTPLADAVATAAGNIVSTPDDFIKAIDLVKGIPGIQGILIIQKDQMAVWGNMEIAPIRGQGLK